VQFGDVGLDARMHGNHRNRHKMLDLKVSPVIIAQMEAA